MNERKPRRSSAVDDGTSLAVAGISPPFALLPKMRTMFSIGRTALSSPSVCESFFAPASGRRVACSSVTHSLDVLQ